VDVSYCFCDSNKRKGDYLNGEEIGHKVSMNFIAPVIEIREEDESAIDLSVSARSMARARNTIDREFANGLLKRAAAFHILEEPSDVAVKIRANNSSRLNESLESVT
jgi:hypothetical protein